MRRLGLLFAGVFSLAMVAFMFSSCSEDPAPPVAEVFYEIGDDGFTVTFTATTQNVTTYAWDFGDETSSTETSPSHTYGSSGDYEVSLVATGDGGSVTATKSVSIASTIEEMLTGGPGAANGKTWVLGTTYNPGVDGAGPVLDNLVIGLPSLDNILAVFGLGDEYSDTFTFNWDGGYTVDNKNDLSLAGIVYGSVTQTIEVPSNSPGDLPLCAAAYNPPANGTWSLSEEDYTVTVFNELIEGTTEPGDITFTFPGDPANKVTRLVLSDGQYFGVLDTEMVVIIKEITADKIHVAMGLSGVGEQYDKPTLLIHTTFVPAE